MWVWSLAVRAACKSTLQLELWLLLRLRLSRKISSWTGSDRTSNTQQSREWWKSSLWSLSIYWPSQRWRPRRQPRTECWGRALAGWCSRTCDSARRREGQTAIRCAFCVPGGRRQQWRARWAWSSSKTVELLSPWWWWRGRSRDCLRTICRKLKEIRG